MTQTRWTLRRLAASAFITSFDLNGAGWRGPAFQEAQGRRKHRLHLVRLFLGSKATVVVDATKSATATITVTAPAVPTLIWKRSSVYAFGTLISEDTPSDGTIYIQGDQVGSPTIISNAVGQKIGDSKNLPFGERFGSTGIKSSRRYTNHEDQPGSAIYMQARTYLPAYGKFAQVDPAYDQTKDDPESWNLYGYVTNNPVTRTDPDGRTPIGQNTLQPVYLIDGFDWTEPNGINYLRPNSVAYELAKPDSYLAWVTRDPDGKIIGIERYSPDPKTQAGTNTSIQIFHYADGNFTEASEVTSANRFINGMKNDVKQAQTISEVEMGKMKISEFDLVHIPTLGFVKDLVRALADKLGFTTQTAKQLAGIIQGAGPGNWYAHSYGGVAFAEAVRTITKGGGTLAGQSTTFLAGANNRWVTNSIMRGAGVSVRGYYGSWFDLVPNVVGLNSLNPIQWAVNIIASPLLATRWSPHTFPPVE